MCTSMPKTWDLMRLIDYVAARGAWSLRELGCVGFSGGGMQTLYLAALDERVRWALGAHQRLPLRRARRAAHPQQ